MCHILNHKINHSCFFRGNSEENECFHKDVKRLVHFTNLHIEEMASQTITTRVHHYNCSDLSTTATTDLEFAGTTSGSIGEDQSLSDADSNTWTRLTTRTLSTVAPLTGRVTPKEITNTILSLRVDQNLVWEKRKLVCIPDSAPRFNGLRQIFGVKSVYGKPKRHDAVLFNFHDEKLVEFVYSIFAPR